MWNILNLFKKKDQLLLNFCDQEYDTVMNLFRQIIYIDKIQEAVDDDSNSVEYVNGLMDAFVQIYITAGDKIMKMHHKKPLDMSKVDLDEFIKEVENTGVDYNDVKNIESTMDLLREIHNVSREFKYNKLVSNTFHKTIKHIAEFSQELEKKPDSVYDVYDEKYGYHIIEFLKSINDSIILYKQIGHWLKEDKEAIAKYKLKLKKKVVQHALESH